MTSKKMTSNLHEFLSGNAWETIKYQKCFGFTRKPKYSGDFPVGEDKNGLFYKVHLNPFFYSKIHFRILKSERMEFPREEMVDLFGEETIRKLEIAREQRGL